MPQELGQINKILNNLIIQEVVVVMEDYKARVQLEEVLQESGENNHLLILIQILVVVQLEVLQ